LKKMYWQGKAGENLNWLDLVILFIITWSAWRGLHTGLVGGLARLLAVFLGLAAALKYHSALAAYADRHWQLTARAAVLLSRLPGNYPVPAGLPGLKQAVPGAAQLSASLAGGLVELAAFAVLFFLTAALVRAAGEAAAGVIGAGFLGPLDRIGGLMLGFLRGLVLAMVVVALLLPLQKAAAALPGGGQLHWLESVNHAQLAVLLRGLIRRLPVTGLPFYTYL